MSNDLVVQHAHYAVGDKALLSDVSFTAKAGQVTGLIGPNGAGKSTLMRTVLGLLPLNSGSIHFAAEDLPAMPKRQRAQLCAFVEQSGSTEAQLSVRDAVLLGRIPFQSVWQATPSPEDNVIVANALAAVNLGDFSDRLYHTLSGGEQQRVHLARALAQQPHLLVLDEPTNHLDVRAQLAALTLLRERARTGTNVLLALHDLNLAASYCDALVVLHQGRVVAAGPPDAVLTPALLREVYSVDATLLTHPQSGKPLIAYNLPA